MKKLALFVAVVLLVSITGLFADDAKVLPSRVIRLTTAPTYIFTTGEYDDKGKFNEKKSGEGNAQAFNLGFALEYGVNDFISAAVQWAPGWTLWSEVDTDEYPQKVNVNGLFDLFAGAKIQLVGSAAPVKSDTIRLAIAPGVKIPMPGVDFKAQGDKAMYGQDFTGSELEKHAWGFGGRFYTDFILSEAFYINVYAEYIQYLERKGVVLMPVPSMMAGMATVDVNYGYDLTFELEPHFDASLGDGIIFGAGVPLRYKMAPATKAKGLMKDLYFENDILNSKSTSTLSISPSINFFFMKAFIPTEIGVNYNIPLYGTSSTAAHSVTLKIKNYMKF